jgi:hypothetical protein
MHSLASGGKRCAGSGISNTGRRARGGARLPFGGAQYHDDYHGERRAPYRRQGREQEPGLNVPQRGRSFLCRARFVWCGRLNRRQPPGASSSNGSGSSGGASAASRTVSMISATMSPRSLPAAPLSRYRTAARIVIFASSSSTNSQSSKSDMVPCLDPPQAGQAGNGRR